MVIRDVGYQLFATVDLVVIEVDFYCCQWFGSDRLGLVCDVVVEFGLGEGLVVGGSRGEFLNLAGLVISDGIPPTALLRSIARIGLGLSAVILTP
ncbi:MAG: hypothetical protein V7K67_00105 [Nostoc sp.]|uniref:hypothetical protein n=1 Tax=Nostoc sp. TaxID=1180 RepID=UPI002FEEB088